LNLIDAYRYLAALEQHRHFGRAAAACHITQPALSNALRALETHYDVAIVRRGRLYEGLTPEGEQVLATAHRVLREQEMLSQALAGSAEQPKGRLIVGAVPTAVPVAARFAARLIERHPGIAPQVRSLTSHEIETGLDQLALDLGFGYIDRLETESLRRLDALPQYAEQYYLIRRVDGATPALQLGAPLAWSEAAALRLALLSPDMHNRAILDEVFQALDLTIRPLLETNSVLALLAAVQASGLAAVLPGALVSTFAAQSGLQAQPLVEPAVKKPIGFITAASVRPSRTLEAALRLARDPAWRADAEAWCAPSVSSNRFDQ
jgi:DNA-binding transcriptional LysR family regulator